MTDNLEAFKKEFIDGYIYPAMDRLLDLMNIIKRATTKEEIAEALEQEKRIVNNIAGKDVMQNDK